eukprot:538683-Rhodomonas_salina.1
MPPSVIRMLADTPQTLAIDLFASEGGESMVLAVDSERRFELSKKRSATVMEEATESAAGGAGGAGGTEDVEDDWHALIQLANRERAVAFDVVAIRNAGGDLPVQLRQLLLSCTSCIVLVFGRTDEDEVLGRPIDKSLQRGPWQDPFRDVQTGLMDRHVSYALLDSYVLIPLWDAMREPDVGAASDSTRGDAAC